ncbi:MAG: hypothetical protein JWO10_2016 [Microbacteriaceae bacterium]|nr:hypothetical protein [Microbacteriaceae bacterium]
MDAWVQSAALLAVSELVVLGDALVRRRSPLATVAELHSAIVSGGRGVIRLRQAVKLIRPGVDSPRETLLRLLLGRAHLPEPEVNGLIVDGNGHFLALGDLVYREWRVVVEYDGEHHFASAEQVRHDLDRAERLVDAGWRVLRFNRMHMSDPVGIAHKVRHVLAVRQ